MLRLSRKGQGTLEYAALIACIVAGILIMQRYFNRAAQGRWKSSADQVGDQFDFGKTEDSYKYTSKSKNAEVLEGGIYSTNLDYSTYEKTDGKYQVNK